MTKWLRECRSRVQVSYLAISWNCFYFFSGWRFYHDFYHLFSEDFLHVVLVRGKRVRGFCLYQYYSYDLAKLQMLSFCLQVTTHSRLLSSNDLQDVAAATSLPLTSVTCLSLQQFHTEQQFCTSVR